jgi:hypothetical protein
MTSGLTNCATTHSLQFSYRYFGQRLTGRLKRGNERPSM